MLLISMTIYITFHIELFPSAHLTGLLTGCPHGGQDGG